MALTTRINARMIAALTGALDLGTPEVTLNWGPGLITWASGVAANQADMIWTDQRTVAASTSEDLDLAGVLVHHLTGAAMTFARMKGLGIYAAAGNTNDVHVIDKAATGVGWAVALGDGVKVKPGGLLLLLAPNATGYPVTPTSNDLITITNGGGTTTVTYDVAIIGASA